MRTRFGLASALGGLGALAVFAWVVLLGRADPLAPEFFGNFYDAQARSLFDGRWDVPTEVVSWERFAIDGKYYMYFGPWPAILRMPVLALTHAFDGRLSRMSMLLGFTVLLGFTARLSWQAHLAVRGTRVPGWRTLVTAGGFVFVVGCGSTTLFLGSRAWVYHEAILWAVAWSVAAFSWLISYLSRPRTSTLVCASLAATGALLSRPTVGLGPALALALILALHGVAWAERMMERRRGTDPSETSPILRWVGIRSRLRTRSVGALVVAALVPPAIYVAVNHAKFGTFLSLPYEKQDVLVFQSPERRAALAATGNRLMGLEYIPSNLVQYLRPDAIGLRRTFPWLTFAATRPPRALAFDPLEPIASVTATSVLLCLLTVVGTVVVVRGLTARAGRVGPGIAGTTADMASFRVPLLAALLAAASTTVVSSRAFRYETDLVPAFAIGGAVGLWWALSRLAEHPRWTRNLLAAGFVALGAWSCWANFALTLVYQREYSGFQAAGVQTGFFDFQLDVNEALGLGFPPVRRSATLPVKQGREEARTDTPHGTLLVVGDCDGLYIATGRHWQAIETRAPGQRRWRVTFGPPAPGKRQPLWSSGDGPSHILWARWIDGRRARLELEWTALPGTVSARSAALRVDPRTQYVLDVRLDPAGHTVEVSHRGRVLFESTPVSFDHVDHERIGRQPDPALGATRWPGTIDELSVTPICRRLLAGD